MANTMNPVDLYHDPALDGLIHQKENVRRTTSARRRSSGDPERRPMEDATNTPERMLYAPEVPRVPPISYRNPVQDGPPQRSFSQRAKGRPFAREAFADEGQLPSARNGEDKQTFRPRPVETYPEGRSAQNARSQAPEDLRVDTGRPTQRVGKQPQYSHPAPLASPARVSTQGNGRHTSQRPFNVDQDQPIPAVAPSSALRRDASALDEQHRDWAPDRSPLQKLEVTLNDISKEEKRARVQEAEMLLRESKAKRTAASGTGRTDLPPVAHSQRTPSQRQPVPSDAATIEDAGLVRNLSSTHRSRLQHSTVIDNHRPDARRLSGEGNRGFDYSTNPQSASSEAYAKSPQADKDVRGPRPDDRGFMLDSQPGRNSGSEDMRRTADAPPTQPGGSAVPSNITRAVSMQGQGPYPEFREDDDRTTPMAEREVNASHKAALAKLTGESSVPAVSRGGSRKLQKAPPIDLDYRRIRQKAVPQATKANYDRIPSQRADEYQRNDIPTTATQPHSERRDVVGLGVNSASPAVSSPQSLRVGSEQSQTRPRRASVTFKEPAVRRPVDEWKEAKIARLSLADFALDQRPESADKNKTWWEANPDSKSRRRAKAHSGAGLGGDAINDRTTQFNPPLYLRCGPLLRYTGMRRTPSTNGAQSSGSEIWRGSVMIVTQDSQSSYQQPPVLRLFSRPKRLLPPPPAEVIGGELAPEYVDPLAGLEKVSRNGRALYVRPVDHLEEGKDLSQLENDDGLFEASPSLVDTNGAYGTTTAASNKRTSDQDGEHLGRYQEVAGARLYADPDRDVTFWRFNLEIELGDSQQHIAYRINRGASSSFWVPARGESMNIMFHSCNGFSASVKPDLFSGPDPLWRDVLNVHQTRPFHVMIGGGDQIYNDRVRLETQHFGAWTRIKNPQHKHEAPFTSDMKEELESFYLHRYANWFSQGLFGMATSQIPMVNIWDDHDIIDGFGSYPDHFMKVPVFSGLGNVAFKYYMLFQHQSVPEETTATEPSWVLGHEVGPYIHQHSRSLFMHMGKHLAFLGVDCRTERMRDEILSIRTFDLLLERCRKEIVEGETKHLIVLLGVPIAYPRLVWLENVLTSRAMDPIKMLGRAGVLKPGFLNTFDGGVEILDDLDDHWTASHHKSERNDLIKDLQDLAAEKSVRITILGGDVHLAAIGQFYSNPKLKIPKDKDHRYMPNVISSAIVNTPPPDMMADIINKRDKTHHLDKYTDENMIPMFTHDVDHKKRNNTRLLPRRNWCSIREYIPGSTPPPSPSLPATPSEMSDEEDDLDSQMTEELPKRRLSLTKEAVNPRGLFRRISSRRAPPSSYKDAVPGQQHRSASYDGSQPARGNFFGFGRAPTSSSQRTSMDSQDPQRRVSSLDNVASRPPVRPGMLRRPTNLSEKAAKKGNVPAIDANGNEIDVNDHVNLEGGLDIVLNVEVNQKDPAGITTPYRLLVPALWYDGSSDREKLDSAAGVHRKPTILSRFGLGSQRQQKAASNQGAGNWGQEISDTESYAESEEVQQKQQPRRRFSLFGNRRRKHEEASSDYDSEEEVAAQNGPPNLHQPPAQRPVQNQVAPSPAIRQQAPMQQVTSQPQLPAPMSKAVQRAYETGQLQQRPSANAPNGTVPSQRLVAAGYQPPQPSRAVQRAYETRQLQNPVTQHPPNSDVLYDTTNRPPPQHFAPPAQVSTGPRRSLTITSQKNQAPLQQQRTVSDDYPIQTPTSMPAFESRPASHGRQNQFNAPPQPQHQAQRPYNSAPTTAPPPQRRLSKQERVLGLGVSDSYAPGSQPLRGHGIIGAQDPYGNDKSPKGYSGIEAWKDPNKPKRGFSFKRAREWLDGRRNDRYDDEDSYDEDYEEDQGFNGRPQGQKMY